MPKPYPDEAKCETCGHMHVDHGIDARSTRNERGYGCRVCGSLHAFLPIRLAGGSLTPEDERAAYLRALRGEV